MILILHNSQADYKLELILFNLIVRRKFLLTKLFMQEVSNNNYGGDLKISES